MAPTPPPSAPPAARPHTVRARPNVLRRGLLAAAATSILFACTAPPELRSGRLTRIETVPAGARLITLAGEVYRTPVDLPLSEGGTRHCELRLRGYEPRRIALDRAPELTPLRALSMCTLLPLLAEAGWERVLVVDGRARIDLVPSPEK